MSSAENVRLGNGFNLDKEQIKEQMFLYKQEVNNVMTENIQLKT